jgi:hypothetical protein
LAAAAGWAATDWAAGRAGRRTTLVAVGVLLAVVLCALAGAVATGTWTAPATQERENALDAYPRLPLAFVANSGRLDRSVRYTAQSGGASFFFTSSEAVASFAKGEHGLTLRLRFLGANPEPAIVGARPGTGKVNFLVGDDPAKWRTNLTTYRELVYRDLWPGVSMHVRGGQRSLKYEFRLKPGGDPSRIRLAYRGQDRLSLGRGGHLRMETALGVLRDSRPVSYQVIGGRRVPVASRFALGKGGAYGFALGAYDRRHPLVIDPGLVYSTYLGGSRSEALDFSINPCCKIAVDGAGNAYVVGSTTSSDFPTTTGAFDTSFNGGSADAFVTKLNAAGSAPVYSTYLGGSGFERGFGIAVDAAGSAYVTGRTASSNFPTTPGAYDTNLGGTDAFVTKLNAAGSDLVYSTYLGGPTDSNVAFGIEVDAAGAAYVAGIAGSDFPTTPGAFDTVCDDDDPFVTKLNAAGSALVYSTCVGGGGFLAVEFAYDIAVDSAGSAYITGETASTTFPTTPGAFDTSFNGSGNDVFVTKLNAAGSALAYSTYLGGSVNQLGGSLAQEYGFGIAVDAAGSAYVVGLTRAVDFPTTAGAFDTSHNSFEEGFVTKLSAAGSALAYSTFLGGNGTDLVRGVAVDDAGSAYLAGDTDSTNFPTTTGAFDTSWNISGDAFVTKLNAAGSALAYSTYLGGRFADTGAGIAFDSAGNAYVVGATLSPDFPTTPGAFDTTSSSFDAFVTKLDLIAGPPAPPPPPPPAPQPPSPPPPPPPPPPVRPPPPPPPPAPRRPAATPAPGPRDVELRYDPKRKRFLINVQYVLRNRSCRNPCPARAEIRTRTGRRLYAVGALPGDGRVVLGKRRGIKIPRGRKVFFWIPIKAAQLRKVHFRTIRGYRYGETRLRVWLRTPAGEALTVRDGRIRVSIARIKSGALPNLRGIL